MNVSYDAKIEITGGTPIIECLACKETIEEKQYVMTTHEDEKGKLVRFGFLHLSCHERTKVFKMVVKYD